MPRSRKAQPEEKLHKDNVSLQYSLPCSRMKRGRAIKNKVLITLVFVLST